MTTRMYLLLAVWPATLWFGGSLPAQELPPPSAASEPVIDTGVPHATQDKPQSKLWHAHGHWWAWLPTQEGSSVWKRTSDGWIELESLTPALKGLPGQADVWADDDEVRAVLVAPDRLVIASLIYNAGQSTYAIGAAPVAWDLEPVESRSMATETATIARDGSGRWWIAWDRGARMWVRGTLDDAGSQWSEPIELGRPAAPDDICSLVALPGQVGLLWTDQRNDAVRFRAHRDDAPVDQWGETEKVDQGGATADDHINTALAADGTLYVATKNEVDTIDLPQFVLRIRRPDGTWENHPYANLTRHSGPTRPIALIGGAPERLYLLHTLHTRNIPERSGFIGMMVCDLPDPDLDAPVRDLLSANTTLNNVTGCKQTLPEDAPWIVLASDGGGGVYEAVLPRPEANQ